jgi:hypothetical protein
LVVGVNAVAERGGVVRNSSIMEWGCEIEKMEVPVGKDQNVTTWVSHLCRPPISGCDGKVRRKKALSHMALLMTLLVLPELGRQDLGGSS